MRVITRYFDSADTARAVKKELVTVRRFSTQIIRLFDSADGLADTLIAAHVDAAAARAYQEKLAGGGAVMLVQAGSKPLNVARITREITAQMGAVAMEGVAEETYVKDPLPKGKSVLSGHVHMLYKHRDPDSDDHRMADWPIPLISRRKPNTASLFPRHARMANILLPLTDRRKPYDEMIFPRHARMANFPLPLISRRKPYREMAIAPHGRMANFPIPLISRRKPYTGSILARHARMANWPFPHLMNGRKHTNSLMPGAPRMANFPIGLLSQRKPNTASIFPRHARMANFPLPLISKRKPFTGSMIGPHARMADMILPLTIRNAEDDPSAEGNGFSLSKMLGLRTVIRK